MESLESILTDLQNKYTDPKLDKQRSPEQANREEVSKDPIEAPIASSPTSLDSLLKDLRNSSGNSKDNSKSNLAKSSATEITLPSVSPVIDRNIQRDLQEVDDRQRAKEQQVIAQKATEWLKNLDPLCGEGLWFEQFAKNYASRLEAAIALIQSK